MTLDSHAFWERARRWASQGRYGDAETAYREALRLVPDDVRVRLGLGLCLRRQRRPADAEAVLREAVLLQPGSASVHAELGGALFEQGKYADAAAAFREATRVPRYHQLMFLLALVLTGVVLGQVIRRVRWMAQDYAERLASGQKEGSDG